MISPQQLKNEASGIVSKYAKSSNTKGFIQIANTLIPYTLLFYLALKSTTDYYWYTPALIFLLALFIVRVFMIMHDCGHNSLFQTPLLNKIFGFITGVIVGMPQYVWAQHHNFHHSTNGNWSKYRGPLSTLSIDEYRRLSPRKQKIYRYTRNILFAPIGAFMYFIFNPRFNWLLGSIKYIYHVLDRKIRNWHTPIQTISEKYHSRHWANSRQYWHMFANNIVLISLWVILSNTFGAAEFFSVYIISLSIAGAAGIIIFTIQHNFDSSYASDDEHWNYYKAALDGTSFLDFPVIANWFSADIAYHHIHHLSARIPNYNLARCHKEYSSWFNGVTRIRLQDIPDAFKYILWDTSALKIISVKQFEQQALVR